MIPEMNVYQWASVLLAVALYAPLCTKVWRKQVNVSLASFILWGSIDFLIGLSILIQGETIAKYALAFTYMLGCLAVIVCVLKAGTYKWGQVENRTVCTVALCIAGWAIVVWGFDNPYLATILSTIAAVLAGIPMLIDSWAEPERVPLSEYVGYTLSGALGVVGASAWTVVDRLFPFSSMVVCAAFVLAGLRKYKGEYRNFVEAFQADWGLD